MKRIHQFVETLVPGDAISNECIQIYSYLNYLGFDTNIYTRTSIIEKSFIRDYKEDISPDDGIIFHHSTNSPLVDYVQNLPNKKMLIYHNITPAAFFKEYNYTLFKIFREAERQNFLLKNSFQAIVGDSKYNLSLIKEFIKAKHEEVLPPFLSLQFKNNTRRNYKESLEKDFTIIFVGRFAPNKKQTDIVKVFEYYSKFINPKARLILIGHYSYSEPYFNALLTYIKTREIKNVIIKGSLSSEDLADLYEESSVFLSMSEHEGFCIPVLESLYFNVPVLAYKIPALEELIDQKYLFDNKNFKEIGARLYKLQLDNELREEMIIEQKKVLNQFKEWELKSKFKSVITQVFNL